ncbi:hypothetical protein PFISCL1PPCAC_16822, partial [Pristionchus fissidentatus]
ALWPARTPSSVRRSLPPTPLHQVHSNCQAACPVGQVSIDNCYRNPPSFPSRAGYVFNLLLALVTLINFIVALLVLRRLARSISASALVAHSLWKCLQLILLAPSCTVLTIALIKDGHLGDARRSPAPAIFILSVCWVYGIFCGGAVWQLASLGRRLWKRKAAAGYPFSRASSMHSVISFISADGGDDYSVAGEATRDAGASDKVSPRSAGKAHDASTMPLVVPMSDFNSIPSSQASALLQPYSPPP